MRLSQLGEFGFIERIRRAVSSAEGIVLGIGDDCAATTLASGELQLTTTDLLIEDIHFRRPWSDMKLLGRKSVAVNVSDIAAMGGAPRHLYLALGIPEEMTVEELDAFMAGFLEATGEYDAALAGGDTCRSPGPLIISVTAEGAVPERELVRRAGAREGDVIYVSGTLGDSALALRLLSAGETPDSFLCRRHHDPAARTQLGRALASSGIPSSMIDLSDGLVADLGHILSASEAGARVEEEALPLSDSFRRALEKDSELITLALSGGEDYELLFTVPSGRETALASLGQSLSLPLTRVGTVTAAAEGLLVMDRSGRPYRPGKTGFNHVSPGV
jgi:thiamine-monophosphate kinase